MGGSWLSLLDSLCPGEISAVPRGGTKGGSGKAGLRSAQGGPLNSAEEAFSTACENPLTHSIIHFYWEH